MIAVAFPVTLVLVVARLLVSVVMLVPCVVIVPSAVVTLVVNALVALALAAMSNWLLSNSDCKPVMRPA